MHPYIALMLWEVCVFIFVVMVILIPALAYFPTHFRLHKFILLAFVSDMTEYHRLRFEI